MMRMTIKMMERMVKEMMLIKTMLLHCLMIRALRLLRMVVNRCMEWCRVRLRRIVGIYLSKLMMLYQLQGSQWVIRLLS